MEGGELPRGDAALGLVENGEDAALPVIDGGILKWLTVAYAHPYTALLTRLELEAGAHPVHVLREQTHHLAVQTFVVLPFSDIHPVAFYIGSYYEDGILVTAYPQALSLAEGEELGAFVLCRDNSLGVEPVAGLFLVMASSAVGLGGEDYVGIVVRLTEKKEFFVCPAFHRTGEDFLLAGVLCGVSVVLREDLYHFSFYAFEFLLKEDGKIHLAYRTNSRRVRCVCRC